MSPLANSAQQKSQRSTKVGEILYCTIWQMVTLCEALGMKPHILIMTTPMIPKLFTIATT